MEYTITQSLLTNNSRYKSQQKKAKYGYMQHSTGTPGAKASQFIKSWNSVSCQAEAEFIVDDTGIYQCLPIGIRTWHCGGSANNTHVACEICEPENARMLDVNWLPLSYGGKNNTTYAVTMLQKELMTQGYDPNGVDGNFGPGCKTAVIAYQKDHGLSPDGSVGLATLHSLQQRQGSYLQYNKQENQPYFEDIYNKAVFTCSYALNQLQQKNIDKNIVCSHAEGYKLKIASNHADVGHWWPQHDKDMDDFRADVKTYMATGRLPFNDKSEPIDLMWAKAQKLGIFSDKAPNDTVTAYDVVDALDQLNLLK